jgi:microcystin-dependent protein
MANPFLAEIRIFPFNFAPTGWALCNGQLMSISQNTALFSLIGTFYGGDGKVTFGLPDLQGAVPLHAGGGAGPGLSQYFLGETGGSETVQLLQSELPAHGHTPHALLLGAAVANIPDGNSVFAASNGGQAYVSATDGSGNPVSRPLTPMAVVQPAGGGQPHTNLMPYVTLNFCIALQGVFPQRP